MYHKASFACAVRSRSGPPVVFDFRLMVLLGSPSLLKKMEARSSKVQSKFCDRHHRKKGTAVEKLSDESKNSIQMDWEGGLWTVVIFLSR